MFRLAFLVVCLSVAASVAADKPTLLVTAGRAIPKGGSVTVTDCGKTKPVATVTDFAKTVELPGDGPFDVLFTPKGGIAVAVAKKWTAKAGENKLNLGDALGTVFVRGDDLPRADSVVVTATDDPGPGEKGHAPVQTAADYKTDMVVPAGTYAVWIKPFNGAKAQRIADNIRVQAGRETRAPE